MTDKLGLYNGALFELGERKLASLTEDREPRRVLDQVYDNVIALACEEGQWNFAERTVSLTPDASIDTQFGFANAFSKPDDLVRISAMSNTEYLEGNPLDDFNDDGGYWYANCDPLFVKYVSNGTSYGLNLGIWPQTFARYVEFSLALRICERLTQNASKFQALEKLTVRAKRDALSKDAARGPSLKMPAGSWVRARMSRTRSSERP